MNAVLRHDQVRIVDKYTYTEYMTEMLNADPVVATTQAFNYPQFRETKLELMTAIEFDDDAEVRRLEHALCLV